MCLIHGLYTRHKEGKGSRCCSVLPAKSEGRGLSQKLGQQCHDAVGGRCQVIQIHKGFPQTGHYQRNLLTGKSEPLQSSLFTGNK